MSRPKLLTALCAVAVFLILPGTALAKSRDRDRDRMPDRWERANHLKVGVKDAAKDADHDGLSNLGEFRAGTDPRDADTDDDGTDDANEDRDRDGVDNANEVREATNPRMADTNHNGRPDGREDRDRDGLTNLGEDVTANDPTDRDTDDDGTLDGKEDGGVVVSFAGNVLTVMRADGSTVTGAVTAATEIGCKTEFEHESGEHARSARDGADDRDGDTADSPGEDGPGTEQEHRGDGDNRCTAADLVKGVRVHEAKLEHDGGQAVFEEVQILK